MKNLNEKDQSTLSLIFNAPSKGVKSREVPYPESLASLVELGLVKEIGVMGGSKCYILTVHGIHVALSMSNSGLPMNCGLSDRGYTTIVSIKRTIDDLFIRVKNRDPLVFMSREAMREVNKLRSEIDIFLLSQDKTPVPSFMLMEGSKHE
jgi:hypothetical protein